MLILKALELYIKTTCCGHLFDKQPYALSVYLSIYLSTTIDVSYVWLDIVIEHCSQCA